MEDRFDLNRFLDAQSSVYPQVLSELRGGQKRTHWIWFIFPQLKGLGSSANAHVYGIGSLEEAQAYWSHPLLGSRLDECTRLVLHTENRKIGEILGAPDDLKFRSSMTLFSRATQETVIFTQVIDKYFAGLPDPLTLELLG